MFEPTPVYFLARIAFPTFRISVMCARVSKLRLVVHDLLERFTGRECFFLSTYPGTERRIVELERTTRETSIKTFAFIYIYRSPRDLRFSVTCRVTRIHRLLIERDISINYRPINVDYPRMDIDRVFERRHVSIIKRWNNERAVNRDNTFVVIEFCVKWSNRITRPRSVRETADL